MPTWLLHRHNISMPRELPNLPTRKDAVRYVIDSNMTDGYPPTRFIQATQNGEAVNLLEVCQRLIDKAEILEWLEKALTKYPTLVTIEDFVQWRGRDWGFNEATILNARARSQYFDQLVSRTRYVSTAS